MAAGGESHQRGLCTNEGENGDSGRRLRDTRNLARTKGGARKEMLPIVDKRSSIHCRKAVRQHQRIVLVCGVPAKGAGGTFSTRPSRLEANLEGDQEDRTVGEGATRPLIANRL